MPNLPTSFIQSLHGLPGFNEVDFLNVHASLKQVTSIRLNPLKQPSSKLNNAANSTASNIVGKINEDEAEIEVSNVPWCEWGRYLSHRPSFTFDPTFHAGAYYVQEASSMFIDHMVQQISQVYMPERILDLCGAPGGKSTLLAARLPDSFIVSNEVIKSRVTILAENLSKWGSSNVMVTHNDPKDFKKIPGFFDMMVVDAPCSGSGLFRKDVHAIDEWSEANVTMCSMRQQRILQDALVALKENGYLIYSTCSYSKQEDEDICDWLVDTLKLEGVSISINDYWGIVETLSDKHKVPGYRFYPDRLKGEGFFAACFIKRGEAEDFYQNESYASTLSKTDKEIITPFLNTAEPLEFFKQKETIIAFPRKFASHFMTIQSNLHVRKSGVAIGVIKGKDLVPHHELALSHLVNDHVPHIELSYDDAIKYLKRLEFQASEARSGWTIIRYKGFNLGWAKVLPNRINNYYPTEWRILKH